MLYVSTGITNDAYIRRRSCRLMCARMNHTVHSLRNATLASCLRLATSSASPSSDPSLRVIRHSSSIRSTCRLILVRSVFEPLMVVFDTYRKYSISNAREIEHGEHYRNTAPKHGTRPPDPAMGKVSQQLGQQGQPHMVSGCRLEDTQAEDKDE